MSLQIGIVGLPNAGKSTLFNALTRAGAAVAPYPFTTIDPNRGVVPIPDPRLEQVAALVRPERVIPATVEFVDIAGLVKGAHQGEGLGNQFLGHIRNVDAILIVLRCFTAPDVPHVTPELDPRADMEVLDLELSLADLEVIQRRREKVRPPAQAGHRELADELALLERLGDELSRGRPVRVLELAPDQREILRSWNLLTAKPRLYVANVDEKELPEGGPLARGVREAASVVVLSARLEAELAEWPPAEAAAYRRELGLARSGVEELIAASYRLLDLMTFFTATGTREVRAWTLPRGASAWEAAGRVHRDMQQGFIRAEVISWEGFLRAGSFVAAREAGRLRSEGRDYLVQDGEVLHFRFQA